MSVIAKKKADERIWTWMVYMAGDNNLEGFGVKDLIEMKSVGSTEEINIVAEFDRMTDEITRRFFLTRDLPLAQDCVEELPEINTGDPGALIDFCKWAVDNYPARHYALILWNHGSGWKDDDIYRLAQDVGSRDLASRGLVRGLPSGKARHSLFRSTMERMVTSSAQTPRAILFDDSAADFLDSQELERVLNAVREKIGHPLDFLGFDACLMSMLEVACQVQKDCNVMAGSQENEPGGGWPYDKILGELAAQPGLTPNELGSTVVNRYLALYREKYPHLSVTQSAIDLGKIEELARAVGGLGNVLFELLQKTSAKMTTTGLVFRALRQAQSFTDRDYVDLLNFCQLLNEQDGADPDIVAATRRIIDVWEGTSSPIIATGQNGPRISHANGLSIYIPVRTLSPLYQSLNFAHLYQWDEFIQAFIGGS